MILLRAVECLKWLILGIKESNSIAGGGIGCALFLITVAFLIWFFTKSDDDDDDDGSVKGPFHGKWVTKHPIQGDVTHIFSHKDDQLILKSINPPADSTYFNENLKPFFENMIIDSNNAIAGSYMRHGQKKLTTGQFAADGKSFTYGVVPVPGTDGFGLQTYTKII
jgi:hypothetical protein